jgi:hypothetical protein
MHIDFKFEVGEDRRSQDEAVLFLRNVVKTGPRGVTTQKINNINDAYRISQLNVSHANLVYGTVEEIRIPNAG